MISTYPLPRQAGADSCYPSLIIYIHGYGSNGLSSKARHYKQLFGHQQVLAPSLPKDTRLSVDCIEQLISVLNPYYQLGLIGSSLGGYLAIYFAEKYNLPAALINPAIPPWTEFEAVESEINTASQFVWLPEHFKRLAPYRVPSVNEALASRLLLLQQLDDEVLDAKFALEYLSLAEIILSQGGGHRFANIADFDQQVCRFFQCFEASVLK